MTARDCSQDIQMQLQQSVESETPINITGNGTKSFLGQSSGHSELNVSGHQGIISYEPTELVIKARCGTPIVELEKLLSENGQMMPFEPPMYGGNDTLGGVIACGLSGPRRPYAGAARDFVLGTGVLNGRGEHLLFGGEVMKNVAGYDVSRLQVGAMGTLGIILDVAMKVLPEPESNVTLILENRAINDTAPLVKLARQPLPLSASMIYRNQSWVRLSGSSASVQAAANQIGGEMVSEADALWDSLRRHTHTFFCIDSTHHEKLWRVAMPDYAAMPDLQGDWLIEWGGALRWLKTDQLASDVFAAVARVGGHATRYSSDNKESPAFQPLNSVLQSLHNRVRKAFDPKELFNPGRFHND